LRETGRRGRAQRKRGQQGKNGSNRTFSAHYRTFSETTSAKSERGRELRRVSLFPEAVFYVLNARLVQYQWYSIGLQERKWLVSAHSV
jgi:hypothetical protein